MRDRLETERGRYVERREVIRLDQGGLWNRRGLKVKTEELNPSEELRRIRRRTFQRVSSYDLVWVPSETKDRKFQLTGDKGF